jgi:hypothetical protein
MDDRELKRETRLQRMRERLGVQTPRCAHCGHDDVRCLEAHHIAGRKFDDATVILCRNCHRVLSDDQKDHPPRIGGAPSLHERAGHFLKGLTDLFTLLVAKLYEFSDELIEFAMREASVIKIGDNR